MAENKIIVKGAKVVDPRSSLHGQTVDFLFEDHTIKLLEEENKHEEAEVFTAENLHVSPGWVDIGPEFGDPGYEHREDIESGLQAALHGGYTSIAIGPNSLPVVDNKTGVEYIERYADEHWMELFSLGAFSKALNGEELTEMYDMYEAGAIGFSHADVPIQNIQLLKLALQYNRPSPVPLQLPAYETYLSTSGQIHEGDISTLIGLKGIPALTECLSISRDLKLAEYAEAAVHFNSVSSHEGIILIREAQKNGQAVTADAAIANLYFTDEAVKEYNTNLKVLPPIRAEQDRKALLNALADNTLSLVRSQHTPQDVESKKCEFDHAAFGAISLEACFGALRKRSAGILSLERIVELLAYGPRDLLHLEIPHIEPGAPATLTFFDPDVDWTFTEAHIYSKSKNSPFIHQPMKGKAFGVFCQGTFAWAER